jgi:phosphoglycolate phosphatase-like HAD superfamily hydrolase
MYKLWLFDFDNTIARLEPEVDWAGGRPVLERYLRSVGAPDELFERIPRGNLPLYDAYRKIVLADTASAPRLAELRHASEIIEKIELAGVERAKPLEGALETMAALRKAGASFAIVTSNSSRTVKRWFEVNRNSITSELDAQLDTIVGRDSLLALKPAPDMVLRVLEICLIKPADAAFVGDSEADLLAARTSGVRFYGIAESEAARDRLLAAGATEIYSSPAALAIHLNLPTARLIKREDVSARARVDALLNASDLSAALKVARAIEHPWYRCQSLSNVAEHCEPLGEKQELVREAFRAARECENPNRIVSVAFWPFKVLADNGLANEIRQELEPLLEILNGEQNPICRIDALAPLLSAFRNGPMDCFYRVLTQFEEGCRVCKSWKGDYNLRYVAPLVDKVDPKRATELLDLIKQPRMRRRALKDIESARAERIR